MVSMATLQASTIPRSMKEAGTGAMSSMGAMAVHRGEGATEGHRGEGAEEGEEEVRCAVQRKLMCHSNHVGSCSNVSPFMHHCRLLTIRSNEELQSTWWEFLPSL